MHDDVATLLSDVVYVGTVATVVHGNHSNHGIARCDLNALLGRARAIGASVGVGANAASVKAASAAYVHENIELSMNFTVTSNKTRMR